ncbi:AIPR family protein [Oculatella sp. FACHB-28]|uniref:AIPR family protein n=1 Tax=Oculatella sp. FACHB-28 TaxID=2692845 RepID=UPI0016837FEE|nr:AIPR family protein [Oculatella sp. FACHB-28]MBD2055000.1 AIPR family protein [Oculatella sp. FACHB-28]
MSFSFQAAFEARSDLKKYQEDALALFALQLRFQIEDIDIVATSSLTGKLTGGDDKKCDLIYVDKDRGYIVVIQTYMSLNDKPAAKSSKASDLNAAAAWLLNSPIDDLPQGLQPSAEEVRSTLEGGNVKSIQFWYVHNLPESANVKAELQMVEQTINNSLRTRFSNIEVENVSAIEVGRETIDEWYRALEAPILITEKFRIPISGGYTISNSDWESFVTAVPIAWFRNIVRNHRENLFSANVRGYLGSKASSNNINNGIKETAKNDPSHFWVYNNGITALVSDFQEREVENSEYGEINKAKELEITGISIVNGAQTTGAVGSLVELIDDIAMVQVRFVKCSNIKTIRKIIEYNNRQNTVEISDFRSNDPIQRRLRQEFEEIPDSMYYGGRRGGHEDIIRRQPNLLSSDTVAQALAAFHQEPVIAYNNKSDIWAVDTIYSNYFSERTSAKHIVFVYSLLRSIEAKKRRLVDKNKTNSLSEAEQKQLDFFQRRGPHILLTSAIAKCLDTFLGKPIPNPFRVSFGLHTSPQEAEKIWEPVVEATVPFCKQLLPAVKKSLNNADEAKEAIDNFKNMVESAKEYHTSRFEEFAKHVQINL